VPSEVLRRSVSVLFQDPARLQLTVHDNVALGDPSRLADRAGVERAAAQAGADEVVEALPEGWEQVLGKLFPGGTDLSIGQWQRLALARALFRDAPLLVMDEPSSALDARAEASLFERVRERADDRTVLFISHRFSTVRQADRIYVLHEGRVVEEGVHAELVALGGRYAELYRLQATAFAADR
jgi:ATP-binding cassette subfamily B protein